MRQGYVSGFIQNAANLGGQSKLHCRNLPSAPRRLRMCQTSVKLWLWDNVVLQQVSVTPTLGTQRLQQQVCVSGFRLVHCAGLVDYVAPPYSVDIAA